MSILTATTTALKEWAVCEAALARGETIVLLRKGGIREAAREFRVEHETFALYPTYEHQRGDLLKPAFQPLYDQTLAETPAPGTLRVRLWLEVTDGYEVMEAEALAALSPYHIWSDAYAEERLRWRPKKPLHVLLVRAYHLAEPLLLPYDARYGGCSSWVELAQAPDLAGRAPVLDDAAYDALASPIRALLRDHPASRVRSERPPSPGRSRVDQVLQVGGALMILAAYMAAQFRVLDQRSYPYLLLNLFGSALLGILAYYAVQWGFVLLEGVWAIVSAWGLFQRARGSTPEANP